MTLPGTEGYAAQAERLIPRYEEVLFADKHRPLWPFFGAVAEPPGGGYLVPAGVGVGCVNRPCVV